jgi:hypothetical protein
MTVGPRNLDGLLQKKKREWGGWSLCSEKGKEIARMFTNFWLLQLELNQKNFEFKPKEIFQSQPTFKFKIKFKLFPKHKLQIWFKNSNLNQRDLK